MNEFMSFSEAFQTMMEAVRKVPSGLASLDEVTSQFTRGDVTIVSGHSGVGKTTFVLHLAREIARRGEGVLFISLDMSVDALVRRMIKWRPEKAAEELEELPLFFDEAAGKSVFDIHLTVDCWRDQCRKRRVRPAAVIIDHFGMITPNDRYRGQRDDENAETIRDLLHLAKRTDLAFIVVSPLDPCARRPLNERPRETDLSDPLVQVAGQVLLLFREEQHLLLEAGGDDAKALKALERLELVRHRLELDVAKNRHGPTGWVMLFADMATARIGDLIGEGRS